MNFCRPMILGPEGYILPKSPFTMGLITTKFQGLKDLTRQDSQNCAIMSTESLGCILVLQTVFLLRYDQRIVVHHSQRRTVW